MKWCFLLNNASYNAEFLGKLSHQVIEEGDECIVIANSKIAIYDKKKYFHNDAKIFSKVDWCIKNYKKNREEYDGLSWKEFFPSFDRKTKFKLVKFDFNRSFDVISQIYQFIEFIFQKENPDLVVEEPVANIFNGISYNLCKKNNITYLGLLNSRFNGRIDVYDLKHTCTKYEEDFKKMYNQELNVSEREISWARNFVDDFVSHKQLPSYMNDEFNFNKINIIKYYIKRVGQMYKPRFRYLLNRKQFRQFDYESEAVLNGTLQYPCEAIKRKFKTLLQRNIFDSLGDAKNYFLFPLHLQPEASTSVLATYFSDQLNTTRNIAFSLPFPYKLYVKEHPFAVGTRTGSFYNEIKKIPNVVLISPYESVENLIKKSSGVVSLSGTIGMEAVLCGKPVYVLGDAFYSYHPLCRKVYNFDELRHKIQSDLTNKSIITDLENINICFIISYFRNTIPGDVFTAINNKNDINNYKEIYENIKKKIYMKETN